MEVKQIDIENVHMFSDRDRDFYLHPEKINPFLKYGFDYNEIAAVIEARKQSDIDRSLLYSVIQNQYAGLATSEATLNNIEKLLDKDCFTITTAHQPSLFTGPLYYVYKILSAISLCQKLNEERSEHFVPVFVIGGEDHDFEEINHFHLYGKKVQWQSEAAGSVGRFPMDGIKEVFDSLKEMLPDKFHVTTLLKEIENFLATSTNYGHFAFQLTHLLFDKYGLVILGMDNNAFKSRLIPILEDDILNNSSKKLVEQTQEKLAGLGYKPQAFVRDINIFYRRDGIRNRIELDNGQYLINDTDISFSKDELIQELHARPERFSPNVILRPLFQELILPNLAYIGGGGELAYWLERKSQFDHYQLPYPMLIRRMSGLILTESAVKQMEKLDYTTNDIFEPVEKLILNHINKSSSVDYKLSEQKLRIEKIFDDIELKIKNIDKTLVSTSKSELAKINKSLDHLEGKLKKSVKQKEEVQINRIKKLKATLFPSGLQERHDNIFEYISMYGTGILDKMLPHCNPFDQKMKLFVMQPEDRPA